MGLADYMGRDGSCNPADDRSQHRGDNADDDCEVLQPRSLDVEVANRRLHRGRRVPNPGGSGLNPLQGEPDASTLLRGSKAMPAPHRLDKQKGKAEHVDQFVSLARGEQRRGWVAM